MKKDDKKEMDDFQALRESHMRLQEIAQELHMAKKKDKANNDDGNKLLTDTINSLQETAQKLVHTEKELEKKNKDLDDLAKRDALTLLPNRLEFEHAVNKELARSARHGRQFALLFLDLDNFKMVNDSLGHDIGDLLLREVAERLLSCMRSEDFVARLGGDEFAVVLSEVDQESAIEVIANKILKSVKKPYHLLDNEVLVTISIGIALYPTTATEVKGLLKSADMAMYQAKHSGRDNYQYMSSDISEKAEKRLVMERELRFALERQEFSLVYQPILDLHTQKLISVEALLRWQHHDLGLIMPEGFIEVAERIGIMGEIGQWVLQTACGQFSQWLKTDVNEFTMAVNVSAKQLIDEALPQLIAGILNDTGLKTDQLALELTETAIMHNAEQAESVLNELDGMGLIIIIDDFGIAYSSLSRLATLPVRILKIDISFVQQIGKNKEDEAIICSILTLADSLEMDVIAEGVETEQQRDFLAVHGCKYVQGFYFSKPLSVDDMSQYLETLPAEAQTEKIDRRIGGETRRKRASDRRNKS